MLYTKCRSWDYLLWAAFLFVLEIYCPQIWDLGDVNPLNPFNLCSDKITKWKFYNVVWDLRISWEKIFMPVYAILRALPFFSSTLFAPYKIYGTIFPVIAKTPSSSSARVLAKNFCSSLFFRNKTLPSLVIIENSDFCDAAEWGALNRKSRLLRFARIRNLLRHGMNGCIIEV